MKKAQRFIRSAFGLGEWSASLYSPVRTVEKSVLILSSVVPAGLERWAFIFPSHEWLGYVQ